MAGIYIHIPFCKQACHYCNFHFSTNGDRADDMVDAIIKEMDLRIDFFSKSDVINTIYFGGGTPSLLTQPQLSRLMEAIHSRHRISSNVEVTLEANPDDLTREKLVALMSAGINRLSIGLQSFHDSELNLMNRAHSAQESTSCVKTAQDVGITNISIDLIFGVQGSTLESWQSNLQNAIDLDVPHMSCYNLTVEPKTALAHMVKVGKISDVDDELSAQQFGLTMGLLGSKGYDHYEISNYARDGLLSNHNTNYWKSVPYLGLGASAHSYDGSDRSWNIANNALYLQSITQDTVPITVESLSHKDRINEYIMTGLRTKWGCERDQISRILPECEIGIFENARTFMDQGLLKESETVLQLTQSGKYYADQIASDLFILD